MSLKPIDHFVQINDRLATAGQPTIEQFDAIKTAGYQVVVNLALSTSTNAIANEAQIVESLEMQYVHIPVEWEHPTIKNLHQFFDTLNANQDQFVFVHCAKNMRVSVFVYLYRRMQQHVSDEQAKSDLTKIWTPNETWQKFIQDAMATA